MELKSRVVFDICKEPLKQYGYYGKYVRLFFNPETELKFIGYLTISEVKNEVESAYEPEHYQSLDFKLNNGKLKARYILINKHLKELEQENADERKVIINAIRYALHGGKTKTSDYYPKATIIYDFPFEFPKTPSKRFYSNEQFTAIPIKIDLKEKTLDDFIQN